MVPLKRVKISAQTEEDFDAVEALLDPKWLKDNNQLVWSFAEIPNGGNSLKAQLKFSGEPVKCGKIAAEFKGKGTTLSGVEFELEDHKYPIKGVVMRFMAGV